MVDLPSRPLADVDPEFEAMALETGAFTYELHGTSTREKLLQNLANDVCRLHLGLAFGLHVQAATMHGIPYADLLALIRFTAPYAGHLAPGPTDPYTTTTDGGTSWHCFADHPPGGCSSWVSRTPLSGRFCTAPHSATSPGTRW